MTTADETFKKMLMTSGALHGIVLLLIIVKAILIPSEPLELDQAIRVDLVGLPDKLQATELPTEPAESIQPPSKSEPQKLPDKSDALPEPKPQPKAINLEKVKPHKTAKKKDDLASALSKIEEFESQTKQAERKQRIEKARSILIKGNQISQGNSLRGIQKAQFDDYVSKIHNHVQQFWDLPEWLQNDKLRAVAIVFINDNGLIIRRQIERSSGDPRFDAYVLKAVDAASPFPPPPDKFIDLVRHEGIALGFPE